MEIEIRDKKYRFKRVLVKDKQEYLNKMAEIKENLSDADKGLKYAAELNKFRLDNLYKFLDPQISKEEINNLYEDEIEPILDKLDAYINGIDLETIKKK